MNGFMHFIREQGVVGLAVGFILGGAVSEVVGSLVTDIINPVLGIFLKSAENLQTATLSLASAELLVGNFVMVLIDFLVVALVVYYGVKKLGLDKLDKAE